jgi:hypothetical protein
MKPYQSALEHAGRSLTHDGYSLRVMPDMGYPARGAGRIVFNVVGEPACDRDVAAQPHPVEVEIHGR